MIGDLHIVEKFKIPQDTIKKIIEKKEEKRRTNYVCYKILFFKDASPVSEPAVAPV